MELHLSRLYFADGTNSVLSVGDKKEYISQTIELPWRNNQRRVSCIPEGRYRLIKRFTAEKGKHLAFVNVPGRSAILIHAANDAKKELLGCIAPVLTVSGPGHGEASRTALANLVAITYPVLDIGGEVWVNITGRNPQV